MKKMNRVYPIKTRRSAKSRKRNQLRVKQKTKQRKSLIVAVSLLA